MAFRQQFPEAEVSLWEVCKEGFAASFNNEEGLHKVLYKADGTWPETRTRILLRDIPADVLREIRSTTGYPVMTYVGKVASPTGKKYRIESETESAVIIRIFDENGAPLSEEIFPFSTGKA